MKSFKLFIEANKKVAKKPVSRRLGQGHYIYKDYEIEEVGRYDDAKTTRWNITSPGEDSAEDAANTLKDAKDMIDYWIRTRK